MSVCRHMEHMASIWKRLEAGTPGRKCQKIRYTSSKVLVAIVLMQGTAAVRIDLPRTDVLEQTFTLWATLLVSLMSEETKFEL